MAQADDPTISQRVLLLTPTVRDAKLTERILNQREIETCVCRDFDEFNREVKLGAGSVLVAEEFLLSDSRGSFHQVITEQPAWSDLPLLILAMPEGHNESLLQRWQQSANVTLVSRPIKIQNFVSVVKSRLRDRARQYTVRALLESIEQNNREFRQLADSMPNIVFASDAMGKLDYLNRKTFEYIGDKLDLYGDGWIDAIHPDDRQRAIATWQNAIATGEQYQVEFRVRSQESGKHRWHIARGLPAFDDDGKIIRWFGTCTDIHEQKIIEKRLKKALDSAALASKSKSEFIANMSHEIRTPMTAVLGYSELLAENETDPEKLGFLRIIKRNGSFLLAIINDILDLSKIESGKLDIVAERFSVDRLVYEVESMMQIRAAENKIVLGVEFVGKIPERIESDPKRLKQILVNLIGNAVKFTKQGSVHLKVNYANHVVKFEVTDTGIGMTDKQLGELFQPFHQADASVSRQFGGSGLGLVISQRLANMLGGEIKAASQVGKGSTFTCSIATGDVTNESLIVPLANEDEKLPAKTDLAPIKCRVLVVDDRRDVRFLAGHILKKSGAEVCFAGNGLEATELIVRSLASANSSEAPDIVFMDMQMPIMDGYEATSQLRKLGYEKPIIALTADAMQGDMDRCISSGCDAYISKPIDSEELIRVVRQYAG